MAGCIGYGFVGSALSSCLSKKSKIVVYDVLDVTDSLENDMEYQGDFKTFVKQIEREMTESIYFICVPTPMNINTQKCDTRIIDSIFKQLYETVSKKSFVVIKSTIPVGTVDYYHSLYSDRLNIIFNPEFLTQNNAKQDFLNQKRAIFGTQVETIDCVTDLFRKALPDIQIQHCSPQVAEIVKLTLNTFWATKVAFANEIYDVCTGMNIDYDSVINLVKGDSRIGKTHLSVPGADGYRGFGGVCLPKDLNNLRTISSDLGIKTPVLDAVWNKNCEIREVRDWEQLIGKAVSRD